MNPTTSELATLNFLASATSGYAASFVPHDYSTGGIGSVTRYRERVFDVVMTPFSGLRIRTEAAETEVLLGATAAEAEAALRSVATDVHGDAGHQMFAFENSVQVSVEDGAVVALEVALRYGPASVRICDVDLVSTPAADVLPIFTRLNDGEILLESTLGPIFMNLGVTVWRRFSEDDVALERVEQLPSAEEDYGSLEAFEKAFDDEYEQARWLESALICTREYLEAYRQFE